MANIAFAIEHEEGHLFPTFKLARRLIARGHRVAYIGPADAAEMVRRQGLEFLTVLERSIPPGSIPALREAQAGQGIGRTGDRSWMAMYEAWIAGLARGEVDAPVRALRPDLFVTSTFHGAVTLGLYYRYRQPQVLITQYLRRTPKAELAPNVEGVLARLRSGMDELMTQVRLVQPSAHRLGDVVAPLLRMRELILCPAELELSGMSYEYEREVFYVEPSVDLERRPEGDFPWDRIDPACRLIYCAFGSQMRSHPLERLHALSRALVGAMAAHPDWQLVLSTGGGLGPQDLPPLPGNVLVVEWAPQLALLERAAAAVIHGGLGTTKECILLGVPMVVLPQAVDQFDNAERIVHHRLGVQIGDADLDPDRLAALLATALQDPEIRGGLERMRTRFQEVEDEGPSVRRIEEVLLRGAARRT